MCPEEMLQDKYSEAMNFVTIRFHKVFVFPRNGQYCHYSLMQEVALKDAMPYPKSSDCERCQSYEACLQLRHSSK